MTCTHDNKLNCPTCRPDLWYPTEEQARTFTINFLAKKILEAKKAYYSGTPILRDEEYDALEKSLRAYSLDHEVLKKVGTDVI